MERKIINLETIGDAAAKGAEAYRNYLDTHGLTASDETARAFMVSDEGVKIYGSLAVEDVPNVAIVLSLRV